MKTPKIDLHDDDFGAVLNCAVRYCIGRMTYMPLVVQDFIKPLIPHLNDRTLWYFERDIESAKSYGMAVDEARWMMFLDDVKAEIEKRGKAEEESK